MERTRRLVSLALTGALLCAGGTASAQLPMPAATPEEAVAIDDLIEQRLTEFREWTTSTDQQTVRMRVEYKSNELLEGLEPERLNAEQIERLLPLILSGREDVDATSVRLQSLANDETLGGLLARTVGVTLSAYASPPTRPTGPQIDAILTHPAFDEAISSGRVLTPFVAISVADPADLQPHADRLISIAEQLDGSTLTPERAQSLARYWQTVQAVAPSGDERLHGVRRAVAEALRVVEAGESDPALISSLKDQIAQIDGAFARGELIGHTAPEVGFLWTSEVASFARLEDLRGKVVVLDFWATWCNPCIRSFPKLRQLTARYDGFDVVIVGVTAPQGRHHGADGERITTGVDREKEYGLMAEFIGQKKMTWPVAFSERASWTEFGVRGIPHLAIIDPEGVVRHNGLNPLVEPTSGLIGKIEALLTEAGLDKPGG